MTEVQVPIDSIRWPDCCCSCGGKPFAWRQHTENVVLWTIISVTQYRRIALAIPVCTPCVRRSSWWFVAAATTVGAAFLVGSQFGTDLNSVWTWCGLAMLVGIGLALKGTRTKPLDVLAFDPETRNIRLKIRRAEVASHLAGGHGSAEVAPQRSMLPLLLGVGFAMLVVMVAITRLVKYLQG